MFDSSSLNGPLIINQTLRAIKATFSWLFHQKMNLSILFLTIGKQSIKFSKFRAIFSQCRSAGQTKRTIRVCIHALPRATDEYAGKT